ncbi:hypothetical protein D3C85_1753740 [compost metagenome]
MLLRIRSTKLEVRDGVAEAPGGENCSTFALDTAFTPMSGRIKHGTEGATLTRLVASGAGLWVSESKTKESWLPSIFFTISL